MNEIPTSLTFYPSRRKTFLYLIGSLVFTIGAWMMNNGELMGWFASIFFGTCSIVFIAILLPNSSYLRISKKGFEVRSLFRGGFTNWNEVNQFKSRHIGPSKTVVFNYSQEHSKYEVGKKIAKSMADVEGALPDTYGKSAEELAKLLNEWREKFSKK